MSLVTLVAIYFTLWWVVLFAVLPVGVRRDDSPQKGNDPGAPVFPDLKRKFIWTSLISAVILGLVWAVFHFGLINYDRLFDPPGNAPS
ncbi:DUF1467 family protein [Nitrospirillum sp. BR 11164]|uniref:DUF1467 family protein n=1 Tax=Nitrospirillum sp. BR 11164 TaxID=3104324 RepID=UPI002AFF4CE7|nr:DUF1467 family protein [Nitrospirillum sp. BR 11164]MEA1651904.1 DUF1467 family protein [Nitrospirillum sp. BR 11164]